MHWERLVVAAAIVVLVHEFIKRLHRRYQLEGIEIPFPTRTVVTASPQRD
jgi:small-conductance mechanosensitive channel